ncbi:hypothetical protein L1049_010264 [Liquidambar formosana]|uniref:FAS1 domain-containing protein n=1 Tax=Liquidambar formosana TaxID=63359 RepID=A0AAP0N784_LIQFO
MAYYHSLLILLTALTGISATPTSSPPSPATTQSPPPSPLQQQQLNNIIDALIGAGDYGNWANIISAADPSTFPFTVTLFIPGDDAITHLPTTTTTPSITFDPFIFPYHIVPQRLSFSDLQLFKIKSRLPTLLPDKSILITNNSRSNFTVDDAPITHPDLYTTESVSVHGVGAVLDYSAYGGGITLPDPLPTPSQPEVVSPPPPLLLGDFMGRGRSEAACLCTEFPIVVSVVCAAFAFKIHRNPLLH